MQQKATHPIDAALRERLRALIKDQKLIAKRIDRSQGWLNKYINGAGKATIDDAVRLAAIVLLGLDNPLTGEQRKLLRDWESLSADGRKQVKKFLALWRERRPAPRSKSSARADQKTPGTSGRSPGTR